MNDPKAAMRAQIAERLAAMPPSARESASVQAALLLEQQAVWKQAHAILFYAPLRDEPDLWRLLADSLAAGKTVALPRFDAAKDAYVPCQVANAHSDLRAGKFGIREPLASCPAIDLNRLDLVLVPGVAFDLDGRRLGRGRGFYDRLLAEVNGLTCGVAFDEQIVAAVPVGPHDVRLSCILTPTRWHDTGGRHTVLK